MNTEVKDELPKDNRDFSLASPPFPHPPGRDGRGPIPGSVNGRGNELAVDFPAPGGKALQISAGNRIIGNKKTERMIPMSQAFPVFDRETCLNYFRQLIAVDSHMWLLAIGSSLTPLIGLLGTVWGILDAFQAMGAKGSALLSDVAPGLSSALLTTVVGLVVAAYAYFWTWLG